MEQGILLTLDILSVEPESINWVFHFSDDIGPVEVLAGPDLFPFGIQTAAFSDLACISRSVRELTAHGPHGPKRHHRWPTDPHKYRHRR